MDPRADMSAAPPNEWLGPQIIATWAVTFSLAIITLLLRLWTRFVAVKSPGWDDWTAILATCCTLIGLIFISSFLRWGGARHVIYLTPSQRINARKFSNLAVVPFFFGTALTKISIACMVIRLTGERRLKWCMYALIATLILVNGACVIVLFTYCNPTRALWDAVPHAACRSADVLIAGSNIQGAWAIITDIICTSTPLVMVWKLRMRLCKKVAVTVLIGFGLVTTACSIGRVLAYNKAEFGDPTWTGADSVIWTTAEENIGLIAANLPPLGTFCRVIYEKLRRYPRMRYLLSRSGKPSEKFSQDRVPTIGERPKISRDSDFELMRTQDSADFRVAKLQMP